MSFKHDHQDYLHGAHNFDPSASEHKRGPVHRGKNTEGGTGSAAGKVPTTGNDGEVVRKAAKGRNVPAGGPAAKPPAGNKH